MNLQLNGHSIKLLCKFLFLYTSISARLHHVLSATPSGPQSNPYLSSCIPPSVLRLLLRGNPLFPPLTERMTHLALSVHLLHEVQEVTYFPFLLKFPNALALSVFQSSLFPKLGLGSFLSRETDTSTVILCCLLNS